MRLLLKHVYSSQSNYIKFIVGNIMIKLVRHISYTIGNAIPLFNLNKKYINKKNKLAVTYDKIVQTGENIKHH